MLLGPNIVRECPECSEPFIQTTARSGNTFGATFWSDGKIDAPMYQEPQTFGLCPKCQAYFWVEKTKELESYEAGERDKSGYPRARYLMDPAMPDYMDALAKLALNQEEEIYLRTKLLHCFNDRLRSRNPRSEFYKEEEANTLRLINLLAHRDGDVVLRSELHRELGMFDEALKILEEYTDPRSQWLVDEMRRLCLDKNVNVVVIRH